MAEKKDDNFGKGCLFGGLAGAGGILILIVPILGILALIAAPTLLKASDQAMEATVKSNTAVMAKEIYINLSRDNLPPDVAINNAIKELNNDEKLKHDIMRLQDHFKPFGTEPEPWKVTAKLINDHTIRITGYDKNGEELVFRDLVQSDN